MTYIIAGFGVGWQDLSEASALIYSASLVNIDAVNFQAYTIRDIIQDDRLHKRRRDLQKIQLDPAKVSFLKGNTDQCGLDFILTPFYTDAVDWTEAYVDKFNIRFVDRYNTNLIRAIISTGKPLIISCDFVYLDTMPDIVKDYENKTLMFCIPEYPPTVEPHYHACKGKFTGFSSHYPYPEVPIKAARIFADYLEVYMCRATNSPEPTDSAVSLDWKQLHQLVHETMCFGEETEE